MAQNIIELRGITKKFRNSTALDGLSLDIKDGEFLTLLGPSGCGKTTLLRIISGFETPDSGEVLLCGKDVIGIPPERRKVNTVFQSYALFPHMKVAENVAFGLKMRGLPKDEITTKVEQALSMVHLEGFENRRVINLSGGQQQRVALARAVINEPLVLLLDEPFSALDNNLRLSMQVELKRLQKKLGITFIFVTHNQEEAFAISDRIVVMDNKGHIAQIGSPQEIYEDPCSLYTAKFVGDINIFDGRIVSVLEDNQYLAEIDGIRFPITTKKKFSPQEKVHILLRPEDIELHEPNEIGDTPHFSGKVIDTVYKGATVSINLELDTGKLITVSEFFNEDDPTISYTPDERVDITWITSWEVVLPYEE